jgi:long-chain acyl-CoA synthetase
MSFFNDLEKYGDKPCLIDEGGEAFTYQQVSKLCAPIARFLSVYKKLVVVVCENRHESIVGYLAVLQSGCTALLVHANLSDERQLDMINRYQPHYIWKSVTGENRQPIQTTGGYGLFLLDERQGESLHPSLALLLSTSGSTGSPKLVRLTLKNIVSNAQSIAQCLELEAKDKPITTLPMAYSYGLSVINSHLHVGATILLTDSSLMTKGFWTFFREQQATSMAGVPYTYQMLKQLRFARLNLPSLTKMTQAGGKLPLALAQEFTELTQERGIRFYIMYGQTEATARISYVPADSAHNKHHSIGKPIPQGKLWVCANDLTPITGNDIEGELVYEGPNVMLGYAQSREDLANGDKLFGVLYTGDLGKIDASGYAYVTGRLKRFIKLFGNRVSLDDLDSFIDAQGYTGVCSGVDDHLQIAIVENKETQNHDLTTIKNSMLEAFGFNHRAVDVFWVDDLPRSSSGKILYKQLFENGL